MTDRNRLIELITQKQNWGQTFEKSIYTRTVSNGELADHLMANGVIVPPCKVGDTVYEIAYPTTANIEEIKHEKPIIQEHIVSAICKNTRGFRVETTFVSQYGYDSTAWFYWGDNYLYKTKEEAQNKIDEWLKRQNWSDTE